MSDMANKGASQPHLTYFNLTGLGEPIRFLLSYGNEEFIDERLTEEFGPRKPDFPFGKLPVLQIDGMKLHQSMAICRYLGKKYNLIGNTPEHAVMADIMADTVKDACFAMAMNFWERDPEIKAKKREAAYKETEFYLDRLEQTVADNGGYLVKDQLTWADFVLAPVILYMSELVGKDLLASRKALKALTERVTQLPAVHRYIEKRPTTLKPTDILAYFDKQKNN